jgi:hypothetical protein
VSESIKRRDFPYSVLPEQIVPDREPERCIWCSQRLPEGGCTCGRHDGSPELCHWCATGTGIYG